MNCEGPLKLPHRSHFQSLLCCSAVALACFFFSGCYVFKQSAYFLNHQMRARPIEKLRADPAISDSQRQFLDEIGRIRAFATDSMGYVRNRNYTRLVHIDSSYLLAMLSAADSASFTVKKWCYPFIGCFPLRSYFDVRDARRAGNQLVRKGYEICIEKVDGYSTLGIFSDPVYSFMADYPAYYLAAYIFHEQTHATVYLNNVQFSEEFASFMAREGALRYLQARYGPASAQYRDALQLIKDNTTWLSLLRGLTADLDTIYHRPVNRAEKLALKKTTVERFRALLSSSYDSLFVSSHFRGAEKLSFNNAYLSVHMTYSKDLDLFAQLYEKYGRDLKRMTAFAVSLRKQRGNPKEFLQKEIGR